MPETDYEAAWKKLRAYVEREQRSYAATKGRSKDARAYGGIRRKMDKLEGRAQ